MKIFKRGRLGVGLFALSLGLAPIAVAEPCENLAKNLINYTKYGGKILQVQITTSKIRLSGKQHGSYGNALKRFSRSFTRKSLKIPVRVAFSDRGYFKTSRRDKQEIVIHKGGKVQVILKTWGNASHWLDDIQCYPHGIITGVKREPNGSSAVTITVKKKN